MKLPLALLLVALGGAAGSGARAAVSVAIPDQPLAATLLVNVVGAFLLAVLLEVLDGTGRVQLRRRQGIRLLFGTGFCGGFTTYSAVALQSAQLVNGSDPLAAVGYALLTLVLGTIATAGGFAVAGWLGQRRDAAPSAGVA